MYKNRRDELILWKIPHDNFQTGDFIIYRTLKYIMLKSSTQDTTINI